MGMHLWIRRRELKQKRGGPSPKTSEARRERERERERRELQVAEQMGQQHAALYTAAHDGAEHRCRCQEGGRGQRDRELLGARHVYGRRGRGACMRCGVGRRQKTTCWPRGSRKTTGGGWETQPRREVGGSGRGGGARRLGCACGYASAG